MLVDYPREWRKYIIEWSDRRFRKDTPIEIIEKAKKINKKIHDTTGVYFFNFEDERHYE